jgi:hypothetical protein
MMQNTENQIFFNFSYLALKLLGKGLYSNPWSAIVELVANGLDADATNIYIYINKTDKEHSSVEIFDDGYGMGYQDLVEKYAFLGKNKREDILDIEKKSRIMGRKGVGKLAGMYLSDKYYLFSKTPNEYGCWCLDMRNNKEYDRPCLERVDFTNIVCKKEWNSAKTGTMIKLDNVDLRGIGDKTIEGLKKTFSDFFLLGNFSTKIHIAVVEKHGQKVIFETIKKEIAFKNMTAIWNNSNISIEKELPPFITMPSIYDDIAKKKRETTILPPDMVDFKGEREFKNEKGEYVYIMGSNGSKRKKKYKYSLVGWIGIHKSIRNSESESGFLKNKAYASNTLRLYVRNKLAVSNLFDMIVFSHAMKINIEGEISFDVLDDDDLGDIANTSRDKIKTEDERVILLQELVRPIIIKLIDKRVALGTAVNEEEKAKFKKIEEAKAIEEKKKHDAEKRAIEAEEEARFAKQACCVAEKKYEQTQEELSIRTKQAYFLEKTLTIDARTSSYNTHVIKCNAEDIERHLKAFMKKYPNMTNNAEIQAIAFSLNKIIMTSRKYSIINYDFKRSMEQDDLGAFIEQYFSSVREPELHIEVTNTSKSLINFPYQDITMVLYNIVSNAIKAGATKLTVQIENKKRELVIRFIDNGNGVKTNIEIDTLFDFGVSYTRGTGIGLAQIKYLIENDLHGKVILMRNEKKGVTLEVRIPNEN